jgi:hypothetical protein
MGNSYDSLGVLVVLEVQSYGPVLAIQIQSFASVLSCRLFVRLLVFWKKNYRFVTPGCTAFCFSAVVR